MQGKSNSFRQISPFYPRIGVLSHYVAFPLDNNGNPNQQQPFGCLTIQPLGDLVAVVNIGSAISPSSKIYALKNIGGAAIDWTATVSESWVSIDNSSGSLAPGAQVLVEVSVDECLPFSEEPYTDEIVFTNVTNDCGSATLGISISFVPVTMEFSCRSRSGTATLVGWSEFVDPSTPPRKYRVLTQNNSQTADQYNGAVCGGPIVFNQTCTLSGVGTYDALTGAYSQIGSNNCGPVVLGPFSDSCGITTTTTQTTSSQFLIPDTCCPFNFGIGSTKYTAVSGSVTLSAEDTEADAIVRFQLNNDFGEWEVDGQCVAGYEQRTGFSFGYADAEFRLVLSGLEPGASTTVTVEIWRRPYGSGSYAFSSFLDVSITADGSGNVDHVQSVPNAVGFQSYATNPVLYPTSTCG